MAEIMMVRGLVETGAYEEALTIALQSTEVARRLTFNILLFVNLLGMCWKQEIPES